MSITVQLFTTPAPAQALAEQVVQVYREAFGQPPYNRGEGEIADFAFSFAQHVLRDGFRLVCAREEGADRLLGIAYGYNPRPGQWWYEQVAGAMLPEMIARWLADGFQLAELAVRPDAQGQGIGGRLHDALLDGLPHRTGVLSTIAGETLAAGLYRRRGWIPLVDPIRFAGVPRPYRILGLDLEARRTLDRSILTE
jgi:ribosomal protein S18 acetylase RimI-like enzyme